MVQNGLCDIMLAISKIKWLLIWTNILNGGWRLLAHEVGKEKEK